MPAGIDSLSRRGLLGLAALAAAGLAAGRGTPEARGDGRESLARLHSPSLRLPSATANGSRVPIVVETAHPLEPGHPLASLEVVNPRDPVPVKGTFHFTPANGRAYVAFQARFDAGPSSVVATADCPRHGRFSATGAVVIAEGGGGCTGAPPGPASTGPDDIQPPVIRIPRLVADGAIAAGEVIDVQVKTKHPNRTGLSLRDGRFVQDAEPFHLTAMEVVYAGALVSRFAFTAALSDNPLITFKLRARPDGMLRVTLTNTRGQRFEASQPIRPA